MPHRVYTVPNIMPSVKLAGKLEIRSPDRIAEFLNSEHVGRIASIDADGFAQIIPMNFVFVDGAIYMHSHIRGEKLDNISKDPKVGFEVDREVEFLPSYFADPHDASLADTLYVSVVIKGTASVISDKTEKTLALNGLMSKYQPEGGYDEMTPDMRVLDAVAVIKIVPHTLRGKYKIGQHLGDADRLDLAQKILDRNTDSAQQTIRLMGFEMAPDGPKMAGRPDW